MEQTITFKGDLDALTQLFKVNQDLESAENALEEAKNRRKEIKLTRETLMNEIGMYTLKRREENARQMLLHEGLSSLPDFMRKLDKPAEDEEPPSLL